MKLFVPIVLLSLAAATIASAQNPEGDAAKKKAATSGELFDTVARMDGAVFDAFNAHALERLMAFFTDDLEFYDDGDGFNNYAKTKEDFQKLFLNVPDIRRELVAGTLEVYPLKDYGAIEVGQHRFCHSEKGNDGSARQDCGVFKFTMVWRKTGETWKLSRVLSYAH